jgi:putative effector of murein hydrolase
MTINQLHFWSDLARTPVFGPTITVASYLAGRAIQRACRHNSMANPVLIGMLMVVGLLKITGVPYQDYYESTQAITFLLGPATVALARPANPPWLSGAHSMNSTASFVDSNG